MNMKDFEICPDCKKETCEFWDDHYECISTSCGSHFYVCHECGSWEGNTSKACYFCKMD